MSQTETNKEIVRRYLALLEARDKDAAAELIADDATWWYVNRGFITKADIQGAHTRIFGLTDAMSFEIVNITAEDDRVATETHVTYKTKKGETLDNDVHMLVTIKDGKFQHVREYYNMEAKRPSA